MYTIKELADIVEKGIYSLDFKKEPEELYAPIEYMFSIGGKRIRPRLALLTASLFSELSDQIIYPALGMEVFHAFTLIHDDIMDKADIRRGQPTVYKKWNDNIAILSGDVMSILAYQYVCKASADKLPKALELFSRTAAQVCEGQQYDMNYETKPVVTMVDYEMMIGLKTGVLLACSAKLGAILGGADEVSAQALYDYGYKLGLAFQITDDYLDTFGDPAIFGKNIGGDITNNKKTWLYVDALRCPDADLRVRFDAAIALPEDRAEEKIALVQGIYNEMGVKEHAEKEIERYFAEAMSEVGKLPVSAEAKHLLEEFATMITYRKK